MPFIILAREDIPNTVLQLTELKPNNSLRNYIYDMLGQTKYVQNIPFNSMIVTSGAGPITTNDDYVGLGAYLIDRVEDQSAGQALTAAIANDASAALISRARNGQPITDSDVTAALVSAGAGPGTGLTVGSSTGTLMDVLSILAGRNYYLPGWSEVEDAGNAFNAAILGIFNRDDEYLPTYDTGEFKISNGIGQIANFKSSDFFYGGFFGPALVVYADDGTLL